MEIAIIFPHQLFEKNPVIKPNRKVYLIEEFLFFKQYKFHKQKIAFHRASMKAYADLLKKEKDLDVQYIEATTKEADIRTFIKQQAKKDIEKIHFTDPTDDWLHQRIIKTANAANIELEENENPQFLNSKKELESFFKTTKKKFFQTAFYKAQRKERNILITQKGEPEGGKWSYDAENRKKYPKNQSPPPVHFPNTSDYYKEAVSYTEKNFSENPGELPKTQFYPIDHKSANEWFNQFLENRFHAFGTYEDAIVKEELILNHSVLTPLLNVGLLLPDFILKKALSYSNENNIPLNSTEGFVRQIMGWREFMRGVYQVKGSQQRTRNFWGFERKLPPSFYTGETGIPPVDDAIKKVLKHGYCHHIERLMILGNFMVLCEIDPDDVYLWFMELFIDAYDWVMVPNIYGMSQFADGGLLSTKPYISGSNYILKMSNYSKGDWADIWDALFWRFLKVNRDFFAGNPRLNLLLANWDKMDQEKQNNLINTAENFLKKLN